LTEAQRELDHEKSTIKSYLQERFTSDDQILSRLPGIASQLVAELESSDDEKSIEQWCNAIISFRSGEIKARVDAVFLQSLSSHGSNGHSNTPVAELEERKVALQAEMEELHSEIASVAEMVVEHELRKPMNEMKERRDREVTQARGAWLNYVRPDKLAPFSANSARSSLLLITWASVSTLLRPTREKSTNSNKHWHSSTTQLQSVCQTYTQRGQLHLDEEQHPVHL
jgi:hypothetical protein